MKLSKRSEVLEAERRSTEHREERHQLLKAKGEAKVGSYSGKTIHIHWNVERKGRRRWEKARWGSNYRTGNEAAGSPR